MKKILSVMLSIVMAVSVCAVATIPAMATTVNSKEDVTQASNIKVEVNGGATTDVTFKEDTTDPSKITFTYTGSGKLEGWTFVGLVEGVDYEVVSTSKNPITIVLLNNKTAADVDVIANAIVKTEDSTEKTTVKDKDNGNKSPNTGATMSGVLVAGAGVAMLAALKKKSK